MTGVEVAAISAGLAAAVGAVGAISQSRAAANVADYNAKVAENDAIAVRQASQFEEQRVRERNQRLMASQKAAFGAAGVRAEGSPLMVLQSTAEDAEIDALAVRYSGSIQEARAKSEAAAARADGRAARTGGFFRAGTSLLTGASGVAKSGIFDE